MPAKKSRFIMTTFSAAIFLVLTQLAVAQYSVFYTFTGTPDGSQPNGELIQDPAGNFYGTTRGGGANQFGSIFKIDPSGSETVLYSFQNTTDGISPEAGLFRDPDGNLYGMTNIGGVSECACGTIFKLDTSNTLTVLHTFNLGKTGSFPRPNRLISVNGVLYGTTASGGASGLGVIFKITKGGMYSVVYSFTGGADGFAPTYLNRDSAGNIYGTSQSQDNGRGVVFKLDTSEHFSVLYTFTGGTDGAIPLGRVIIDANGNIHGATQNGGDVTCDTTKIPPGCGVIYRIDPSGTESVVHTFHNGSGGGQPEQGVLDVGGTLFGANNVGGNSSCACGVVFSIGNTGEYSVLHTFEGGTDGSGVVGELTLGQDGNIYGSATSDTNGYIFKYTR